MATEAENRAAFAVQAGYCRAMGAPVTAAVAEALGRALDRSTATGRAVLDWPGEPVADALVLRLVGGLRAVDLGGTVSGLFAADVGDAAVAAAVRAHDAVLLPWLAGPPQTNEVGRSAGLVTGLLALAGSGGGGRFDLLEIGSSAGLNLLIDRVRYELGGVAVGPAASPLVIRPEWRGPPPPVAEVGFTSVRGADVRPVDLRDPAALARLRAYVWADAPERLERLDVAAAMVREPPERGDAAEWVPARLAEPQAAGTTRVLVHSVVWQYLGDARRATVTAAMERAGAAATRGRPLAWVAMEPRRDLAQMLVTVRRWPDRPEPRTVARCQSHGAWVEYLEDET